MQFREEDILELLDQQQSVIVAYREYYEEADGVLQELNEQEGIEIEVEDEENFFGKFLK